MKFVPVIFVIFAASCRAPMQEGPENAYREFAAAEESGDAAGAWDRLSKATQAELTREAHEAAKARGIDPPATGIELAFEDARPTHRTVQSIAANPIASDAATLVVTDDRGEKQNVRVVREGSRWFVDLTDEIHKAGGT